MSCLFMLSSAVFAQEPHWEFTKTDQDKYPDYTAIYAEVSLEGVKLTSGEGYQVAAFCKADDNSLRGVADIQYDDFFEVYYADVQFYGSKNEEVYFKLWDPINEVELPTHFSKYSVINGQSYCNFENLIPMDFHRLHWSYDEDYYSEETMTYDVFVSIDGEKQNRFDLELAVFVGDDVRITDRPYQDQDNRFLLTVFGTANEQLTFKLYDWSTGDELTTDYTFTFKDGETIGWGSSEFVIDFTNPNVAQIGDVKYETLAAAVEAAADGDVITLLKNAEGTGVVIDKYITIDFNGKTYSFTADAVGSQNTKTNGFQIKKDNTVVLKNGTLEVAEGHESHYAMLIQNYADLTITDMTLDGNGLDYSSKVSYVLSNNSGEVVMNGATSIYANEEGPANNFAFDSYADKNYAAPTVTVSTTGTIKGAVEVTAALNIEKLSDESKITKIVLNDKGQFNCDYALATTVVRNIAASESGWGTLSAPTAEGKAAFVTEGQHDFYQYEESAELEWDYVGDLVADNAYTMTAGRGYLYANTAATEVSFTGTLNAGTVNYALSHSAEKALAGFNLVGNPFTHDISFAHLSGNIAEGYYVVGTDGSFVATTDETAAIAPFQAVLVQATEAGELAIAKTAAASRSESREYLKVTVANAESVDVAYVTFGEGAGLNKIGHMNETTPMVYVPVEGKNYAVAVMGHDVKEIPVSFKAMTMGGYTISADPQGMEFDALYLTDRMTGEKVNLLVEDYTFVATTNDNADRFVISMSPLGVGETAAEGFIFISNDNLIISNIKGDATVRIVDMMGRIVAEHPASESASISTSALNSGVYMIQVTDENGVKVQKVVIE